MFGGCGHGQGIADVKFTDEIQPELKAGDFKFAGGGSKIQVERLNRIVFAQTETFYGTEIDVEERREIWVISVSQQQAVAGDDPDEMRKRFLDGGEVFKNVRVIKLEIIDNRGFGLVVDELAALIKKGGVILIAFNDDPFAVREA